MSAAEHDCSLKLRSVSARVHIWPTVRKQCRKHRGRTRYVIDVDFNYAAHISSQCDVCVYVYLRACACGCVCELMRVWLCVLHACGMAVNVHMNTRSTTHYQLCSQSTFHIETLHIVTSVVLHGWCRWLSWRFVVKQLPS
jgi:hypothetical protein